MQDYKGVSALNDGRGGAQYGATSSIYDKGVYSGADLRAGGTARPASTGASKKAAGDSTIYESIPNSYQYNPKLAEPILYYLPKTLANLQERAQVQAQTQQSESKQDSINVNTQVSTTAAPTGAVLRTLMSTAEDDVRLHRARIKAAQEKDTRWLRTYRLESDPSWIQRQKNLAGRSSTVKSLEQDSKMILSELKEIDETGLTVKERSQLHLARWQRALELYVYCPMDVHEMDHSGILDKLLEGISEEEGEMSEVLSEAANMCSTLVDVTGRVFKSAAEQVSDVQDQYQVRLEAHEMFATIALAKADEIQNQFRINGRAALQIGHQLEVSESKRRQCESAYTLIRRWRVLEELAEKEAASGVPLKVDEEVRGVIPQKACRMDSLFVKPEESLEAARALKQLRAVVRSRGNLTATNSSSIEKSPSHRFELTANLIARTSDSLEQRLLHSFSERYAAGGVYDFSTKPRPGAIDWRELQALAEALLMFDSGRNLHKRYVDMVISSRFPELFKLNEKGQQPEDDKPNNSDDEGDFDMDATRSTLSSLFHRVSDVCTAEFELIAHVFGSDQTRTDPLEGTEPMPLVVARALLQRVISDPSNGLQARINDLLASIDRRGDFDAGAKKLDTFVVIHEKAAGLFTLLRDASECMIPDEDRTSLQTMQASRYAVESLKGFLTSQELSLSNSHRQGYINLEMRLLHHECCLGLDQAGCRLRPPPATRPDPTLAEKGILEEYKAPVLPLDKPQLMRGGFGGLLQGPLKQLVMRQSLINATDSLARARLMFGSGKKGGETTARVITSIYSQMCSFYGEGYLYPIMEVLRDKLPKDPPNQPPHLPFDEEEPPHNLGVEPNFWHSLERVHSAAKAFDRELWAEGRTDSGRVWETLEECEAATSTAFAQTCRFKFFSELERRGEGAVVRALEALSEHIKWILVTGGESMLATGGTRILGSITGQSGGPYAIQTGTLIEAVHSPAVRSLTYCLRDQFVHVKSSLTPDSFAAFWTALSMRLYDILVTRLLKSYYISMVGALILARDVDALSNIAMLAGTQHEHWEVLRELISLYMPPPASLKSLLIGPEGDVTAAKGLFAKAGRDQAMAFLSRRADYRMKSGSGPKTQQWAVDLLQELGVSDPAEGKLNFAHFSAEQNRKA